MGQSIIPMRTIGGLNMLMVPFSLKMSTSYSTGGDTITLPSTPAGLLAGRRLMSVIIANTKVGVRRYNWDGSTATPKIQAFSAFDTEVTAAVDLSAVTLTGVLIYVG
jgi:hypothetical protein